MNKYLLIKVVNYGLMFAIYNLYKDPYKYLL